MIIATIVIAFLVWQALSFLLYRISISRLSPKQPTCSRCGYIAVGWQTTLCPECGTDSYLHPPRGSAIHRANVHSTLAWRAQVWWFVTALFGAIFLAIVVLVPQVGTIVDGGMHVFDKDRAIVGLGLEYRAFGISLDSLSLDKSSRLPARFCVIFRKDSLSLSGHWRHWEKAMRESADGSISYCFYQRSNQRLRLRQSGGNEITKTTGDPTKDIRLWLHNVVEDCDCTDDVSYFSAHTENFLKCVVNGENGFPPKDVLSFATWNDIEERGWREAKIIIAVGLWLCLYFSGRRRVRAAIGRL